MSFRAVAAWARGESAALQSLTAGMNRLASATTGAAAFSPETVVLGVGSGGGREAELITAFFTRLEPGGVGNDMTSTRGRLALEHVTQQHASAGFSTADRAVAEIYRSIFTIARYAPPAPRGFRERRNAQFPLSALGR